MISLDEIPHNLEQIIFNDNFACAVPINNRGIIHHIYKLGYRISADFSKLTVAWNGPFSKHGLT